MEKFEGNGVFESRKCIFEFKKKVNAFDICGSLLVYGDDRGFIYTYTFNESTSECTPKETIQLTSAKIDSIKGHASSNRIYVLSSGSLYILSSLRLNDKNEKYFNDVHKFALNGMSSRNHELVVVTKQKAIMHQMYNSFTSALQANSDYANIKISELPDLIEFYDESIILISKQTARIYSSKGSHTKVDVPVTYAKNMNGSWLLYSGGTGLFMENSKLNKMKLINFGNVPLASIHVFKNFIISLHESALKVFDSNSNCNEAQELKLENGYIGRYIASSDSLLFLLAQNQSNQLDFRQYSLKEVTLKLQIDKLLHESKLEEALSTLSASFTCNVTDRLSYIEQFYHDAAWIFLGKGNVLRATQCFKLTNFDPSSIIYLLINELSILPSSIDPKCLSFIKSMQISIEKIVSNDPELISNALSLIFLLLKERKLFMLSSSESLCGEEKLEIAFQSSKLIRFNSSKYTLLNLEKFELTFSDCMVLINTTLLKIIIKNKFKPEAFKDLLDDQFFDYSKDDISNFISLHEETHRTQVILAKAILKEKDQKWEEALKDWQMIGISNDYSDDFIETARDRSLEIIRKTNDKTLFKDYIIWILDKFPIYAFDLTMHFVKRGQEIFTIDYFYFTIVTSADKAAEMSDLKEKFLEYFIQTELSNSRYTSLLCDVYIEKLFKMRPANKKRKFKMNSVVKEYLRKLSTLVKSNMSYDKDQILSRLINSWILDLEIHLYNETGRFKDAIDRLIIVGVEDGMDFTLLEQYCKDKSTQVQFDLLGQMFISLFTFYCKVNEGLQLTEIEISKSALQKQILVLLNNHAESQKLDIFLILNHIPGDWLLSDQLLFEFMNRIAKSTISKSNRYKVARSLAETSQLNKEKEILELQSKNNITVGSDTACSICSKRINSTIFSVSSAMELYHIKCTPI